MSSSRDFGFTTLRSMQAYQPNGARVPPNHILTTGENGGAFFTNSLEICSINVSTLNASTINVSTLNASTINVSTLSTNWITMTTGQVIGLSTINGIAWPPPASPIITGNLQVTGTLTVDGLATVDGAEIAPPQFVNLSEELNPIGGTATGNNVLDILGETTAIGAVVCLSGYFRMIASAPGYTINLFVENTNGTLIHNQTIISASSTDYIIGGVFYNKAIPFSVLYTHIAVDCPLKLQCVGAGALDQTTIVIDGLVFNRIR